MQMGNTTGTAFLLRDLVEAHPGLSYNEELAEDIKEVLIEDQEYSFRHTSVQALAQTLNSFATVGKMDPKNLMDFYKTFEDGTLKSNIILDLTSRTDGECLIETNDVMAQFSHDVTEIPVNQLNTIYRTLLPLEESDDVVNSVFEHTLNLMSASPDENTYMRICASREMANIFAIAPESDTLKKAGQHILNTIDRAITDADNETPKDENQALAEYLEVGPIVVNRLPELGTHALDTANKASNVIAEKLSHPKHDWNWSLSVEPSAELKRVAAEAAQQPVPAETQLENYYREGREVIGPIITQALTAPKPKGP